MNTDRWNYGSEFPLLDLVAQLEFKSPSSLSFRLGVKSDSLDCPDMDEPLYVGIDRVFTVVGWLDVHHPCSGVHRLQLRVGLPDRYVGFESMRDLLPQVIRALGLPSDESYRIYLTGLAEQTWMEKL